MKIRFWGVRGSLPTPGPETASYGGNTTCIQVDVGGDTILVIDSGTGIRALSDHLMAASRGPMRICMLVTHTHWDHIHGFPFFAPIYRPDSRVNVYGIGPVQGGKEFEQVMRDQMTYSYFPVEHTMLDNVVQYHDFARIFPGGVETSFEPIPGVTVKTKLTNHPVFCIAYRIEHGGRSFVFTGDHEPWPNAPQGSSSDTQELYSVMSNRLLEFCRGADLVAIDTTYTQDEYMQGKQGWGHSFFEHNIVLAREAGVRRMAFTHHDPTRTDAELDRLMKETYLPMGRKTAPGTEFFAAREGPEIQL